MVIENLGSTSMHVILGEKDDRIINLFITDQYGQVYEVSMEMLNHGFQEDEVNLCVMKVENKMIKAVKHKTGFDKIKFSYPNRVLSNEEPVFENRTGNEGGHTGSPHVWFEFHPIKRRDGVDLPAIKFH